MGSTQCLLRAASTNNSLGPIDITQNTSQSVREETAELASWALSDYNRQGSPAHFPSGPSYRRKPATHVANGVDCDQEGESLANRSLEAEPLDGDLQSSASHNTRHPRYSRDESALSEMIRRSPPLPHVTHGAAVETVPFDDVDMGRVTEVEAIISQPTEGTSLLFKSRIPRGVGYGSIQDLESVKGNSQGLAHTSLGRVRQFRAGPRQALQAFSCSGKWNGGHIWDHGIRRPLRFVPPVILGLLLNVLDALSYGKSSRMTASSNC